MIRNISEGFGDGGFFAEGDVVVVAPDREQSGSSHALTLDLPLRVWEVEPGRHRLTGTPTDCVMMGVRHIIEGKRVVMVGNGLNAAPPVGEAR